jgi:hypothetical protein
MYFFRMMYEENREGTSRNHVYFVLWLLTRKRFIALIGLLTRGYFFFTVWYTMSPSEIEP